MSDTANDHKTDRRGFLKLAGLGTVAGGAAVVTGGGVEAAEAVETKSGGYRLTDHVKRVYETSRF
ncbi:twin-arginine translocation signal domain-containing protein [Breoghania sp. L-A4]|uniref:twin-arginine translocation signal domain-containing protein n=1 Tax=Breoghania sp. L-A4 TaxID=2304600 RepID=UPI000E35E80E|nr:twin-arginine translocation signal domain-containing protein [Breoghania sp. L-A4]AXS40138.1 twin-arginine translocation signal domain-containing protein [Breoghania sp. L-A4]